MTSQADRNLTIAPINIGEPSKTKGFYVKSTAPINVEDTPTAVEATFEQIKQDVAQTLIQSTDPQISIYVHGYSVRHQMAMSRCDDLYRTATSRPHPGQLIIGFLWPSENPVQDNSQFDRPPRSFLQKIKYAFESLPTLLIVAISTSLILGLSGLGLLLAGAPSLTWISASIVVAPTLLVSFLILQLAGALNLALWMVLHAIAVLLMLWLSQFSWGATVLLGITSLASVVFGAMVALLVLRLVTYLRDRERAAYFAVYDLVELIRKLDLAIAEAGKAQGLSPEHWKLSSELQDLSDRPRVKLNFMAHSLGCMVVTNAIRILSDVFDPVAAQKTPTPKLGNTLSLERLVLIAPDIPIEALMPGRSNFLTSTIKRCNEPYVFSNEGDLALRLASTAANYIGYFSRQRFGGYRVGNITCQRTANPIPYGITNLSAYRPPHLELDVRSSKRERKGLKDLYDQREGASEADWQDAIADGITYFDCTDYRDHVEGKRKNSAYGFSETELPVVTEAKNKQALNFFDYAKLLKRYLLSKGRKQIDTHGGYFAGQFSQLLLHELTLFGFQKYLEHSQNSSIESFHHKLGQKQIQSTLSWELVKKFSLRRPTKTPSK